MADTFGPPMPLSLPSTTATAEEIDLVAAIRGGDEHAFAAAVERHYVGMLAVAKAYVLATDTASQIVHDAWMAALAESARFDGGMPLRAWLLRYVVRVAAPLAARADGESPDTMRPAVEPGRFRGGHDAFPGHWRAYPRDWRALPDEVRRGADARRVVEDAVAALPVEQRAIIAIRDMVGCPAGEACAVLDVGCQTYLRQLRVTVEILRADAGGAPSDTAALRAAFRHWSGTGDAGAGPA